MSEKVSQFAPIGTDIIEAKAILESGNLVAIPTETVYGLAGNALKTESILKIFETKNRPSFDPLIVHTHNLEAVREFVLDITPEMILLANHFWPGPLTLLIPKKEIIPDLVTSGLDTVAIRIPNHPLTLDLLKSLPFPLAAPSANPFGYISPTTAQHVADQLGDKIGYILDGGASSVGIESTIIGFPEGVPTIYRLGGIALEDITKIIGPVKALAHSTSNPQAPGMLKSHYAPRKPLTLLPHESTFPVENNSTGYLTFEKLIDGVPVQNQRVLSPSGDINEAAQNLFKYLRELDQLPINQIYGEMAPMKGLGRAINDRLKRAAALPE